MDLTKVRKLITDELNLDPELCPLLIRLSWHCCATFDKEKKNGGSNGGTMRFKGERSDPENKGFGKALTLFDKIMNSSDIPAELTYADIYILGGYVAIEWSGGPKLEFKTGRKDYSVEQAENKYGESGCPFGDGKYNSNGSRLPTADCGVTEGTDVCEREKKTIDMMRNTFNRMGFVDREIVALLLLGHQFGQGHPDVSGYDGFWFPFAPNDWNIPRRPNGGGYFQIYKSIHMLKEKVNKQGKRQWENNAFGRKIMLLPVDMALVWDDNFRSHLKFYDKHRNAFFHDATTAWIKLTELGCEGLTKEKRN